MQTVPLPAEWFCLENLVQYVQRESETTYTSSCPSCGGSVHQDGELPDRCILFVDDHPSLWCRVCGLKAYPDNYGDGNYIRPTPEQREERRQEQIQREQARKRSAERALQHLRDEQLWLRYHRQLEGAGRAYWRKRGITDFFQDWWELGWRDDWSFRQKDGSEHKTASATIPIRLNGEVCNIKHRLINPPPNRGKYIYQRRGLPRAAFVCNQDRDLSGHVIAVEGEVKAAVVFQTLDDSKAQVVGLPGTNPGADVIEQLSQADRLTLVMDPGSRKATWELVKKLSKRRCEVLITSDKIDDVINRNQMSARGLRGWLRGGTLCA